MRRTLAALTLITVSLAPVLAQGPQKKVKDQAEYDLYINCTKEADPAKRLGFLNTWAEKYPDSDFKQERRIICLITYTQLAQAPKVVETAQQILAVDPKEINALKWLAIYTQSYPQPATADSLERGEKAAQALLSLDKPASLDEAAWKTTRAQLAAIAHNTLGYVAAQRKQPAAAEQEYRRALETNPNWCEVSYALGNAILAEKDLARQPEVLYHWARAASLTGAGACPDPQRRQIDAFFEKQFTVFHGRDEAGLKQLRALAIAHPLPPEGFTIKNANEIEAEKQAKFAAENPQLALWKQIEEQLLGANGEQYFESNLKGAAVPKLKGKLVSAKPALKPTELTLAMDGDVAQVTVKLSTALAGKADAGTELQFQGLPSAFTKSPFMLTFDVDSKDKIEGWPAAAGVQARKKR